MRGRGSPESWKVENLGPTPAKMKNTRRPPGSPPIPCGACGGESGVRKMRDIPAKPIGAWPEIENRAPADPTSTDHSPRRSAPSGDGCPESSYHSTTRPRLAPLAAHTPYMLRRVTRASTDRSRSASPSHSPPEAKSEDRGKRRSQDRRESEANMTTRNGHVERTGERQVYSLSTSVMALAVC